MNLRVLLVAPVPPPIGGISLWTDRLVTELANDPRVRLHVVNTSPRRSGLRPSTIRRLLQGLPRMVTEDLAVAIALIRHRPHVIHLTTSGSLAAVRDLGIVAIGALLRKPVIVHVRFGRLPALEETGGLEWGLMRRVLKYASLTLALESETAAVARRQGTRAECLPNFVNVSSAPNSSREPFVLFAGWIVRDKGVLELLEAWSEADLNGWRLKLAGKLGEETEIAAAIANAPSTVDILGELARSDLLALMNRCGVFVLPSHTEGFPNVVAEAMSSGTPIIGTAVGAIPDMLGNAAGVVVPPGNVVALRSALVRLSKDQDERVKLGRRAWHRCRDDYETQAVLSQLIALWKDVAHR